MTNPVGVDQAPTPTIAAPSVPGVIATLPPQKPTGATGYPISSRTGEPQRPWPAGVASGLLYSGIGIVAAGLVKILWDSATITRFHDAARLLSWTKPDPVSFAAIAWVLTLAITSIVVAAATGTIAYQSWNGFAWTRVGGLVAVAVSLLTILLNAWAMWAMVPIALGAGLLWLPQHRAFTAAFEALRAPVQTSASWPGKVTYGPLGRYRA